MLILDGGWQPGMLVDGHNACLWHGRLGRAGNAETKNIGKSGDRRRPAMGFPRATDRLLMVSYAAMKRRLRIAGCYLSLSLFVASAILWARSYRSPVTILQLSRGDQLQVITFNRGEAGWATVGSKIPKVGPSRDRWAKADVGYSVSWLQPIPGGLVTYTYTWFVPCWLVAVLFLVFPASRLELKVLPPDQRRTVLKRVFHSLRQQVAGA